MPEEPSQKDKALLELIDEAVKGELEFAKALGYEMSEEEAVSNVEDFIKQIQKAKAEASE